ncbi:MAG: vWA domain-containing protein [Planctomycetota bacterium]
MRDSLYWLMGIEPEQWSEGGRWSLRWLATPSGDVALGAIVVIALVVALFFWLYRREGGQLTGGLRTLLFGLRVFILGVVVVMLLEPALVLSKVDQVPSKLLVLVDTSPSMGLSDSWLDEASARAAAQQIGISDPDTLRELERIELVEGLVGQGLLAELAGGGKREVHVHTFDERLTARELDEPEQTDDSGRRFTLGGRSTSVGESIQQVLQAYRGQPLAGVVVITDGQNSTPGSMPLSKIGDLANQDRVPIFSVGVGTPEGPRNASIRQFENDDYAFVNDTTRMTVTLTSRGLADEPATVVIERLIDGSDDQDRVWETLVDPKTNQPLRQQVTLAGDRDQPEVTFDFTPDQKEQIVLRARLEEVEGEIDPDDNASGTTQINVIYDKTRVLFLAGYTFPEVQFLRNTLLRDDSVEVASWLQEAEGDFRQPANGRPLIRLPNTLEEINQFDCVVLYDPDPSKWPVTFSELLVDFVSELGGGLVYVAGERNTAPSFDRFNTGDERVGYVGLLPVIREPGLFRTNAQVNLTMRRPWKLQITDAGMRDAIFTFNRNPATNQQILNKLPGMMWHFAVTREKPGATVLARHGYPGMTNKYDQQEVLLATHLVGPGRVVYLGFDSSYRWRFVDERLYDGFWARVIDRAGLMKQRGGQHPFRVSTDRTDYEPGDEVTITARFIDAGQIDAGLTALYAEIETGGDQPIRLELAPVAGDDQAFAARFIAERAGDYLARVWPGRQDSVTGAKPNSYSFAVVLPDFETANPTLDSDALRLVSNATGGKYVALGAVGELPAAITTGLVDREQVDVQDIWDAPLLVILFLMAILAEWILRKKARLV